MRSLYAAGSQDPSAEPGGAFPRSPASFEERESRVGPFRAGGSAEIEPAQPARELLDRRGVQGVGSEQASALGVRGREMRIADVALFVPEVAPDRDAAVEGSERDDPGNFHLAPEGALRERLDARKTLSSRQLSVQHGPILDEFGRLGTTFDPDLPQRAAGVVTVVSARPESGKLHDEVLFPGDHRVERTSPRGIVPREERVGDEDDAHEAGPKRLEIVREHFRIPAGEQGIAAHCVPE